MQNKSYTTLDAADYPPRQAIPVTATIEYWGPRTTTDTQISGCTNTTRLNDSDYPPSPATLAQTTGYSTQNSQPSYLSSNSYQNVKSPMYHTGMGVSGHGIPPMHTMSQYYYPQRFFPQMPFRGVHQNIPPPLNQYPWLQAENHDHQKSPNTQGQRKKRAAFSKKQLSELEKEFEESRFCSKQRRAGLAASLELSDYQVKVWFQNRRMKWKKRFSGSEDRKKADQVKKDSIGDEGSAIPQHLFKQDCNALSSVKDLLKGTTSALQPLSHQINYVNWDHTDTKPEKYVHTISSTSNTYC